MTNRLKIFSYLILILCFSASCEIKNQFKEKQSKSPIPVFTNERLKFALDISDFTKGELTVMFSISQIKQEYKIDSFNLLLHDNKSNESFELLKINTYDGMFSRKSQEFKNFNSFSVDRKMIDSTIQIYYALDHTFHVSKVDATKEFRIDLNAKFSTKDSSYIVTKSLIFKRSKHFVPIRWSGC